jgi:hypothetical protein
MEVRTPNNDARKVRCIDGGFDLKRCDLILFGFYFLLWKRTIFGSAASRDEILE